MQGDNESICGGGSRLTIPPPSTLPVTSEFIYCAIADAISGLLNLSTIQTNPILTIETIGVPREICDIKRRWKEDLQIAESTLQLDDIYEREDSSTDERSYTKEVLNEKITSTTATVEPLKYSPLVDVKTKRSSVAGHQISPKAYRRYLSSNSGTCDTRISEITDADKQSPESFGHASLKIAMRRLNIDGSESRQLERISLLGKCDHSDFNSPLVIEKRAVKERLKLFDYTFKSIFGNVPTKKQKEPMRLVYAYYKRLRAAVIEHVKHTGSVVSKSSQNTNTTLQNDLKPSHPTSSKTSQISAQKYISSSSMTSSDANGVSMSTARNPDHGGVNEDLKRLRRLEELKFQIATRLNNYQEQFYETNRRKIIYHKDIVPVEGDYKKYKILREQVNKLSKSIKKRQHGSV